MGVGNKKSIITGITTLFSYGLTTGGPGNNPTKGCHDERNRLTGNLAVMTIGWIVVSFFTMFVALGMAEITSAIPSAGGTQVERFNYTRLRMLKIL